MSAQAAQVAELLRDAQTVVALTGAGISVPSGIPDFRTPQSGLWANADPMQVAHIDAWRADPVSFWSFYANRFHVLEGKQPNGAHHVLAELERDGRLAAVVTQNIDGLHRHAGQRHLIEVHGTVDTSSCLRCRERVPIARVRELIEDASDGVPRCEACSAPLKPDVVLFGEWLPESALLEAFDLAGRADVLLCVGSSLVVHPIAQLPEITDQSGGQVVVVTKGETPWDRRAAVKLDGDVVDELEAVAAALRGARAGT